MLDLTGEWRLSSPKIASPVDFAVPGDVHSALFEAGEITDPYWRDTETSLDWVHESEWTATREFDLPPGFGRQILTLDSVDCLGEVRINGHRVGQTESQFLRYDFDVTEALKVGRNLLEIRFASATSEAARRASADAIPTPYHQGNCRIGHLNYLRKTQCHGGWDWNIALSPLGIYGPVTLRPASEAYVAELSVHQTHGQNFVDVAVTLHIQANGLLNETATLRIADQTVAQQFALLPGENTVTLTARIENPILWWPSGQGAQHRYAVEVQALGETRRFALGLRQVALLTDTDPIGARFAFAVNGREIFMRGANWIPADALPARGTPEAVRDLLTSAIEANMNMIRVWGGGQYEADWFYDLCDELGLMVWHDFMFACNLYPAHDRSWLRLVEGEATQQVRRLSRHACLALWCGDNELVGALTWYDVSTKDRDRYLAIYDRLNHTLEQVIDTEGPDVPWWPSSPSVGRLNFGDGWHVDSAGDMHFWDVWHAAKDFEHYRTVRPRFCSEFGFQSFPSMRVIESFTDPRDRNVSSPVMDVHQRNPGGNSRIVETIARYFRFPDSFGQMVYLSQLSHGLAMKTAIEFWRANKPRTMGTLYWQLNDTWPVASWASLEYGGGWKAVHYMARKYFADVLVTAQPEGADIVFYGVNDSPALVELFLRIRRVSTQGEIIEIDTKKAEISSIGSRELARVPASDIPGNCFLVFDWHDAEGTLQGDNHYLPLRPKAYDFGTPKITVRQNRDGSVTLETDRPALFVTWDHGGDTIYDDNCVTLLPGEPRTLSIKRGRRSHLPPQSPTLLTMEA